MIDNNFIVDLHIHSRFSRACSKDLNLENLVKWAKIKGIDLLGTGDFSHPVWFKELKKLKEKKGLYYYGDFPFVLSSEISLVYTDKGKGRRVHLVYLAPSLEVVEKINSWLDTLGRRDYDGRPIFKISCRDFVYNLSKISEDIEVIPAHIWTPWFGVLGSKGGYDSLKDAFGDMVSKIHAIETGISSDPEMNWKVKDLRNFSIISFSDAHSFWPWRLGREATIFKKIDSYQDLLKQIRENSFVGTIEVDPFYGKYHWDGHRNCNFSCSPKETKELRGICPVCKTPLTIGVENRVENLSEQSSKFCGKFFYKILPLHELLSLYYKSGVNTKKIWNIYNSLIQDFKNEFNILLNVPYDLFIEKGLENNLANLILKNRKGLLNVSPGYDGEYGKINF